MRKIIASFLAFSLLLTCAGCSFGKENQGSESAASVQMSSAGQETQASETVPDSSLTGTEASALETAEPMVEVTLPAQYGDADLSQEACDAIAEENHYESVTVNADGSVTYVMTPARHEQLLQETGERINTSLESLCCSEEYPNLVSIKPNASYTEFTVYTKNKELGAEETSSAMNFYLYGGMFQAIAGNPDAVIHVTYRNSLTDETLGETDSERFEAAGGFADVPATSYYYDAVCWAFQNGVAAGTDKTHFSPDAACTRAQLVTFLWRIAGEPEPEAAENPYTDVDENTPGYTAILWAAQQGIVSADAGTEFTPDAPVSRGDTMLVLWRYAGYPTPENTESIFEDVESGNDLCSAVMWAVEQGIAAGTEETTFAPDAECTRAQVVTFLHRDFGA